MGNAAARTGLRNRSVCCQCDLNTIRKDRKCRLQKNMMQAPDGRPTLARQARLMVIG
jgi:hypothetical protein